MEIIEVRNLAKEYKVLQKETSPFNYFNRKYDIKKVVDDISFDIQEGEIVGYLGPNGAGKSTTIKMLTGILVPSSGSIHVNSIEPHKNRKEYSKSIGVVFGQRSQLWWELPVIDSFDLLRHMYKVPLHTYKKKMEMFNDILSLDKFLHTPVRQLSLGQKMRADFAASLIHNPRILFLDEPTIGLDIIAKENIREFILQINKEEKVTVLITTHDIGDIEKLCNRTIVIDEGKVIYEGNIDRMMMEHSDECFLIIEVDKGIKFDFKMAGVEIVKEELTRKWLKFHRNQTSQVQIISKLINEYQVSEIKIEEPNLESYIKKIYSRRLG